MALLELIRFLLQLLN
ncbi:hypothetical protein ACOS73_00001375 [Escherichia coli]